MQQEKELERRRGEIVDAIDWIDAERKRLSRLCFSETRKKWHGEKTRGKKITLMKKRSEWLYRRRCRLREQIGSINATLKDIRRARNGRPSESFAAAFVEVAKEKLSSDVFAAVLNETAERYDGSELSAPEPAETPAPTVLQTLKQDLAAFMDSNTPSSAASQGAQRRETQADFDIADASENSRIFPAYAR